MKKLTRKMLLVLAALIVSLAVRHVEAAASEPDPMYRLYNPNSGEHFYTARAEEKNYLVSLGWYDEGIGWMAPAVSEEPVYRLYNPNAGDHHYTMNPDEKDMLVRLGWNYEGIGWYSDALRGMPLYRQYNPNAKAGSHNYTTSKAENDALVSLGWRAEGIAWYGVDAPRPEPEEPVIEPDGGRKAAAAAIRKELSGTWNSSGMKGGRFAVFDIDGDGVMEASAELQVHSAPIENIGVLLYWDGEELKTYWYSPLEASPIATLYAIDRKHCWFDLERVRGKAITNITAFSKEEGMTPVDGWFSPYLTDEEAQAYWDRYMSGMEILTYVDLTEDNLQKYLSGAGTETGSGGSPG